MSVRVTFACLILATCSAIVAGCMQPADNTKPADTTAKDGSTKPHVEEPAKDPAKEPAKTPAIKDAPTIDARFEKQLLAVGAEYTKYTKIGETPAWASLLCSAPVRGEQLRDPMLSASGDDATHGKKMYFLWAKQADDYLKVEGDKAIITQPVGQAIVKESYHPVEATGRVGFNEHRVKRGDKTYLLGEKYALFVMLKCDPDTAGTDDGWVYATLSPDGKTVTSSGIIKSCVGCHQDCASDSMFGYESPKPVGGKE